MQKTMVGGGIVSWGKKMEKEKEKRRKITSEKGKRALKMHLFGL